MRHFCASTWVNLAAPHSISIRSPWTVLSAALCPVSEVNTLRRQVVEQLMAVRTSQRLGRPTALWLSTLAQLTPAVAPLAPPQVHVLVRTPEQLEAALAMRPASLTLDYLELYGLKPSVERVKAAGIRCRVASPRILKPTEQNIRRFLLSLDCEILVRSGGLLYDLQSLPQAQRPDLDRRL